MKSALKMRLVPENEVLQRATTTYTPTDPVLNKLESLNSEMRSILTTPTDDIDTLLNKYYDTLGRYKVFQSQYGQETKNPNAAAASRQLHLPQHITSPTDTTADDDDNDSKTSHIKDEIINSLPRNLRPKGERLLNKLSEKPNLVRFTDNGNIYIKDRVVADSNVVDLVNDVLRPDQQNPRIGLEPRGWRAFAQVLKQMNIPKQYIGSKKRYLDILDNLSPINTDVTDEDRRQKKRKENPELPSVRPQPIKKSNWSSWSPKTSKNK